jgi:CubicO group peptidase (beta-lactamase class C family)
MTEAWVLVEDGAVIDSHGAERLVPWWSFTKTVLAAAALVLVRDGLARLDEPLPGRTYSLRHLLQHRSGVANYGGLAEYHEAVKRNDEPWPVPTLLERVDADRLRYDPGEGWEYSNIGYFFVRELIESLTGENLDSALRRLVLEPLRVESPRIVLERADLDTVTMGQARNYHPGWVYHGLLVGRVSDAALLLHRLLKGCLLPAELLNDLASPFVLPGPVPERPWTVPGYGLGVMTGETSFGLRVIGHTGAGPGSTIGVYRALNDGPSRTAAFFATSDDQARTESRTFNLLLQ